VSRLPRAAWLLTALLALGCQSDPGEKPAPLRLTALVPSPQPLPRGTAHYGLSARLDEKRHEVDGRGHVVWTNRSDRPVREVYLHLYLNAFSRGSLFLRGPAGRSGGLVGREGRIDIKTLTSPTFGQKDLWPGAAQHSPDDPADRTDIAVPLPGAILPGEQLELYMEFLAILPEIVERTGYHGDYHLVAQWFPKLARLEQGGTWAHFAFHPFAEFYADFDDYEVTLDVPKQHQVGATGHLTPLSDADPGRARYLARAESVVDFAWTSFGGFEREHRTLSGTDVHLLMEKDQPLVRAAHWQTLEAGLSSLGDWLGAYPYPDLTVVVPPNGAQRSGGMEYPGFITTGGDEIPARLGILATELLVIHELSHQWFQTLVATDEPRYPFLDEGLASYAEWRFLESQYGTGSLASLLGLRLSRTAGGRLGAFYGRDKPVAVGQPAADFPSFQAIAREVYCRTPLILETLARIHGRERVDTALAAYARSTRGSHPTPTDFYRVLAAYLGQEHLPTLIELFEQPRSYNLGIESLVTHPAAGGGWDSALEIQRTGGPGLPFEVRVDLLGGATTILRSDGQKAKETLSFRHRQPIALVLLDPDERLALDEDPADDRFDPKTGGLPTEHAAAFFTALTTGLELLSFGLGP